MAICLLKILKASKYFPHNNEDVDAFTNDELFVGSLMMRHLNVLQFNAHEIYELLRGDRRNMKPNKNLLIGLGVYPQVLIVVAMQEINFIYPTGVLLQPLVPPPNRKIQHRWVKLGKFCEQEQKDARAKYSRGDLSFFTTRLYNTFL